MFNEFPVRGHQIWVSLQNARFNLATNLARKRSQIDADLLLFVPNTILTCFPKVPTSMSLNDLEIQKVGFGIFLRF